MNEYIKRTNMDAKIFALVHDSVLAEVHEDCVDDYVRALKSFIQMDRGVSIPGYAVGCDFEISTDYSMTGKSGTRTKFEEFYEKENK